MTTPAYLRSARAIARHLAAEEGWVSSTLLPRLRTLRIVHPLRSGWRVRIVDLERAIAQGAGADDWTLPPEQALQARLRGQRKITRLPREAV